MVLGASTTLVSIPKLQTSAKAQPGAVLQQAGKQGLASAKREERRASQGGGKMHVAIARDGHAVHPSGENRAHGPRWAHGPSGAHAVARRKLGQ